MIKKRRQHEFKIGDMVFTHNGNKLNRNKLEEIRKGPFKILRRISNSMYEVDNGFFFIYYLYSQFVQFGHLVEFFNSYINM